MASYKEYSVTLIFGDVSVKEWGPSDGIPVLALHGWQDNAGTFDTLIPLLPSYFRFVCPDLAGHGCSSHYPPGLMYNIWDFPMHIKLLVEHLQWNRFSIIGHSLGGIVGTMFAVFHPEMVENLVTLDMIMPKTFPPDSIPNYIASDITAYQTAFQKLGKEVPSYTHEEARERLMTGSGHSLDVQAADILMKRGVTRNDKGGYIFSRDRRHIILVVALFTLEQHKEFLSRVKCPLLVIKSKGGPFYEPPEIHDDILSNVYSKNCERFKYVEVEGNHHAHLTNPGEVAKHISEFIGFAAKL